MDAAKAYHSQLDARVSRYFEGRGFERGHLIRFGIGSVVDPLTGHAAYTGRACIPYVRPSGVLNLKFRCVEDHVCKEQEPKHEKYLGLPGMGTHLFNTKALLRDAPAVALTEGELDAMALDCLLGMPAVGYPGTQAWDSNRHWARIFEGFARVWVLADGDEPGRKAGRALLKLLPTAELIECPDGADPNSLAASDSGKAWLRERLGLDDE